MSSYDKRKYDGLSIDEKVDQALELLEGISLAFPEGPDRHREVHEAWMKAKKAEEAFWLEIKLEAAKKGIWGSIIILLGLILAGLTTKVYLK